MYLLFFIFYRQNKIEKIDIFLLDSLPIAA